MGQISNVEILHCAPRVASLSIVIQEGKRCFSQ